MPTQLAAYADALAEIGRAFGVSRLEIFGSACTPAYDSERSDLDFLVEYPPDYEFGPWLSRFQELQAALSELFGRKVDLVMTSALRDPLFKREADKTRVVVFDATEDRQVA